jgi:hypothetical protein
MRLGRARAVALVECADVIREVLATHSLYKWAASQVGAEPMAGRATAWAAVLPPAIEVVVRRSRHGGALATLTGELFRAPRAAHELAVSLRLSRLGVPTPTIVAYALYPAFAGLWRCDVMTERLRGADFPDAWRSAVDDAPRMAMLDALARLLRALQDAGAFHADLNLKNVLIVPGARMPTAYALDVDRVKFGVRGDTQIAGRNFARVMRSAEKWRDRRNLGLSTRHLQYLRDAAAQTQSATDT